jgi:hypothetical protein
MSLRYAHLAPDQRHEAVARLSEKPVLALTMRLKWEGFSAASGYRTTHVGSAVRQYVLSQLASLRPPISTAGAPLRGVRAVLSLPPSPPIANERRPGRLAGQLRYGIPEAIRRGFQGSKCSGSSNCNGHFQIETGWFDNTERRLA